MKAYYSLFFIIPVFVLTLLVLPRRLELWSFSKVLDEGRWLMPVYKVLDASIHPTSVTVHAFHPDTLLIDKLRGIMTTKHIVFIGDSVMRYQYLNLVYMYKYGKWPEDFNHNSVCSEKSFEEANMTYSERWNNFYLQTNDILKGETCDCFRQNYSIENRMYQDADGTRISYFQWFGNKAYPMGHYDVAFQTPQCCAPGQCALGLPTCPEWKDDGPFGLIERLAGLPRAPEVVLLNSGIHHDFPSLPPKWMKQLEAAWSKPNHMKVVWRETTPRGLLAEKMSTNESLIQSTSRVMDRLGRIISEKNRLGFYFPTRALIGKTIFDITTSTKNMEPSEYAMTKPRNWYWDTHLSNNPCHFWCPFYDVLNTRFILDFLS